MGNGESSSSSKWRSRFDVRFPSSIFHLRPSCRSHTPPILSKNSPPAALFYSLHSVYSIYAGSLHFPKAIFSNFPMKMDNSPCFFGRIYSLQTYTHNFVNSPLFAQEPRDRQWRCHRGSQRRRVGVSPAGSSTVSVRVSETDVRCSRFYLPSFILDPPSSLRPPPKGRWRAQTVRPPSPQN